MRLSGAAGASRAPEGMRLIAASASGSGDSRSWLDYVIRPAAATEEVVVELEAAVAEDGDCTVGISFSGSLPEGEGECEEDGPEEFELNICWRGRFDEIAEGEEADLSTDCSLFADLSIEARIANANVDGLELALTFGPGEEQEYIDLTRSSQVPRCGDCEEQLENLCGISIDP